MKIKIRLDRGYACPEKNPAISGVLMESESKSATTHRAPRGGPSRECGRKQSGTNKQLPFERHDMSPGWQLGNCAGGESRSSLPRWTVEADTRMASRQDS